MKYVVQRFIEANGFKISMGQYGGVFDTEQEAQRHRQRVQATFGQTYKFQVEEFQFSDALMKATGETV
jgi:hypothetical protein